MSPPLASKLFAFVGTCTVLCCPKRVKRAHLATTTVVDSLSPQRSAGRGLGRGAFDLCLPMVPEELLLSPTLSSTPRRRGGGVVMSSCAPHHSQGEFKKRPTAVAAEVTRRNCCSRRNPPPSPKMKSEKKIDLAP